MDLLCILAFFALLGSVVFAMFLPRKSRSTFSSDEMEAFEHASQVKQELAKVQALVGPAKPPYSLTLAGANIPAPPKTEPPPK